MELFGALSKCYVEVAEKCSLLPAVNVDASVEPVAIMSESISHAVVETANLSTVTLNPLADVEPVAITVESITPSVVETAQSSTAILNPDKAYEMSDSKVTSESPQKCAIGATSSELLLQFTYQLEDNSSKISTYIGQLQEGKIFSPKTSEFRKKRLTMGQKIKQNPELMSPITNKRTSIYASNEIGIKQLNKAPFGVDTLGTFSCHGVEPSHDSNDVDGIHDKINQDRGCVVYPFNNSEMEALLMVFDGHGEQVSVH